MFQHDRLSNEITLFQKIKNLDYILLISVILLSVLSVFVMYSTDGGEILFHTKNHFVKLAVFFPLMIFVAFFNIKFWHNFSYLIYFIVILLLIYVSFFGIKSSGSQRWMDLYLFVLQPSELMKVAIIMCLAKYYHRLKIENVNSFTSITIVLSIILIPIIFVISQPDLGTSILIALSGLIILWLGGVKIKYFIYSFITFLISLPFIISFLKPYQKLRILTFLDPDRDPLGAGYQIIQSKIAIGSGGLDGKGLVSLGLVEAARRSPVKIFAQPDLSFWQFTSNPVGWPLLITLSLFRPNCGSRFPFLPTCAPSRSFPQPLAFRRQG